MTRDLGSAERGLEGSNSLTKCLEAASFWLAVSSKVVEAAEGFRLGFDLEEEDLGGRENESFIVSFFLGVSTSRHRRNDGADIKMFDNFDSLFV